MDGKVTAFRGHKSMAGYLRFGDLRSVQVSHMAFLT
jgi:hypothetical protein